MHVVFIEPRFPTNQAYFVRALRDVGATVSAIGEGPVHTLSDELKHWLAHYQQVDSVTNEGSVLRAAEAIRALKRIDRLEAVVEAHVIAASKVREVMRIPGTSTRTTWLCRDKPSMKEALRAANIPCARSGAVSSIEDAVAFAREVGFPLILKPRDGAGASGTVRVDSIVDIVRVAPSFGLDKGRSAAIEQFIEGHEGFYDTLCLGGHIIHDFACHYYPNVLDAMRHRWISPQFITTNRIDSAGGYQELRVMGAKVLQALGFETSATHMEWFSGPRGLYFSEIGCRPPGVKAWDLYNVANDMDLYREWANLIVHGRPASRPSRRYSAGLIAVRPECDGVITGYEGVDAIYGSFGHLLIDAHLPPPGTRTQPVEAGYMANAWLRFKHQDYDVLRSVLDTVGKTLKVRARPA